MKAQDPNPQVLSQMNIIQITNNYIFIFANLLIPQSNQNDKTRKSRPPFPSVIQMSKDHNKQHHSKPSTIPNHQLHNSEKKLVETWLTTNINNSYQEIVLQYLDQLTSINQWIEIERELRKHNQRNTFYHQIDYLVKERKETLQYLTILVDQLDQIEGRYSKQSPKLGNICDLLDHIRKTTMIILQKIIAMFDYYKYDPNKDHKQLGFYYIRIFKNFNKDLEFLKDSDLSFFIPFSENYDPLFLEPMKKINRKGCQENIIIYDQNVQDLFSINASYLYRLLRAHQKMIDFLTLSQRPSSNSSSLQNAYKQDFKTNSSKQPCSPKITQELKKSIRKSSFNRKTESISKQTQQNAAQQIKKIQKDNIIDKRKLVHCMSLSIDAHDDPLPVKKISRNINHQQRNFKDSQVSFNRLSSRALKENLKTIEYDHERAVTEKVGRKEAQKKFSLPKIAKTQKKGNKKDETQCFCRQKYNQHKRSHTCEDDLSQSAFEQRRKSIIREINNKYRQQAKKEIRFQLSKLGDRTYHQMRSRTKRVK